MQRQIVNWERYIEGARDAGRTAALAEAGREKFSAVREVLGGLITSLKPEEVIVLGAGVLSDIPFRRLIHEARRIHLVEWIPGLVEAGLSGSILIENGELGPDCAFCHLPSKRAANYCEAFKERTGAEEGKNVCASYQPNGSSRPSCGSYAPSSEPDILTADATAGYAETFGSRIQREVESSGSMREAISRGLRVAKHSGDTVAELPLADHSADLIVSSMLISQFEYEPLEYFLTLLKARFGEPKDSERARLENQTSRLAREIRENSLRRHFAEINRLLKPQGHAYISFEMMRRDAAEETWFLVRSMHEAVARLAEDFDFDFDRLPLEDHITEVSDAGGRSVVYGFLVRGKSAKTH